MTDGQPQAIGQRATHRGPAPGISLVTAYAMRWACRVLAVVVPVVAVIAFARMFSGHLDWVSVMGDCLFPLREAGSRVNGSMGRIALATWLRVAFLVPAYALCQSRLMTDLISSLRGESSHPASVLLRRHMSGLLLLAGAFFPAPLPPGSRIPSQPMILATVLSGTLLMVASVPVVTAYVSVLRGGRRSSLVSGIFLMTAMAGLCMLGYVTSYVLTLMLLWLVSWVPFAMSSPMVLCALLTGIMLDAAIFRWLGRAHRPLARPGAFRPQAPR